MQVAQVPPFNGAGPAPEHVKKRDFGDFSLYHVLEARSAGTKNKGTAPKRSGS